MPWHFALVVPEVVVTAQRRDVRRDNRAFMDLSGCSKKEILTWLRSETRILTKLARSLGVLRRLRMNAT